MTYTTSSGMAVFALSSEKNISLSVCDVGPRISKGQARKRRGAECGRGREVMLLLL